MNFEMNIYSPRWGHDDKYIIEFEMGKMVFRQDGGPRPHVIATHREGSDPKWQNKKELFRMLENDSIYPPAIMPDALEYLWLQWRDRAFDFEKVQAEISAFGLYLNHSTRAKPNTEFWAGYF